MKVLIKLMLISLALFFYTTANADAVWIDSNKATPNLQQVLNKAKKELTFTSKDRLLTHFIAFPAQLPQSNTTLFANLVVQNNANSASIIIGNRADCKGEKDCWMADLQFEVDKNPEIIYNARNNKITKEVNLHRGIQGFFTPEYAMGSTFPANIAWRDGAILYTLDVWGWRSLSQSELIFMANSVIDTLHKEK